MHGLIFETSVWLLAGSTRLISFPQSKDTEIEYKQSQTNRHTARTSVLVSITNRHKHTLHAAHHHAIICRFAFIALSEERQKHRSKPCTFAPTLFIIPFVTKHALYPQQKLHNRTCKTTNTKQKRTATNAQVQYLSVPPEVQVSPYNNSSANQFNFNLQNWISFPQALTHNFHPLAICIHSISKANWNCTQGNKAAQSSQ